MSQLTPFHEDCYPERCNTQRGPTASRKRVFLCLETRTFLGRGWVRKEGRLEAQGEKLLQDLVSQEQALVSKVDAAKAEAAEMIEKAQAEAETIKAEARTQGDTLTSEHVERSKTEAETARADIIEKAEAEVDGLVSQSRAKQDAAVKLVMERVLP